MPQGASQRRAATNVARPRRPGAKRRNSRERNKSRPWIKPHRRWYKMAVHNYIPHDARLGPGARNIPIRRIIEDPYGKDSADTLPLQMCDVAAYFLTQRYSPNAYVRRKRAQRYFDRLLPVLNTHASRFNNLGIVEI